MAELTATEALRQIDNSPERAFRSIVQRAVARAMMDKLRWRSEIREDARDVAEAACYFLMGEINAAIESTERAYKATIKP